MDFILTHRLYIAAGSAAGLAAIGVYRKIKAASTSESKALLADLKTRLDADLKTRLDAVLKTRLVADLKTHLDAVEAAAKKAAGTSASSE